MNSAQVLAGFHDPYDLLPNSRPLGTSLVESHALARALACPDHYILGVPKADTLRILGILLESLRTDERCLVLTSSVESANECVLAIRESVRVLASHESVDTLPSSIAPLSSHALVAGRVQDIRREREATFEEQRTKSERWGLAATHWDRLAQQVETLKALDVRKTDLLVGAESLQEPNESDVEMDAEQMQLLAKLPELRRELSELSPVVSAKRAGKVFTLAYWKATLHGEICERADHLEAEIRRAEQLLTHGSDRTPFPTAKLPGREEALTKIADERATVMVEFEQHRKSLQELGIPIPDAMTPEQTALARRNFERQLLEQEVALNQSRLALDQAPSEAGTLPDADRRSVRVAIGPWGSIQDALVTAGGFDRVIVVGAEALPFTEWEQIAPLADRIIILDDFQPVCPACTNGKTHPNGTPADLRPICEAWKANHRPLWSLTDGRLHARLRVVVGELSVEPLADHPEIELRFGTTATGDYVLADVLFPKTMNAEEARTILAREIGEYQLAPLGPATWNGHEVKWSWAEPLRSGTWIDVEEGIREHVTTDGNLPVTLAVSFDPDRWPHEQAEEWIRENTTLSRCSRASAIRG